ncbi:hypothetical protein [Streptomyces antimycoticus]
MSTAPSPSPSHTVLGAGAGTGIGALSSVSLARAGHRVFASMRDPRGRNAGKADEVVRVAGLPVGQRPRRAIADGSDYGAEIINGAAEELRLRLARRMGITGLLGRL